MQIGILESKDFSKNALNKLSKIGNIEVYKTGDIDIFLQNKEILFIRLEYLLDINFFNKAKQLRYLCSPTTGLNHIDIKECIKRNIKIISLKNEYDFLSTIRATPEHTFGLTLSLLRNYKKAFLSKENSDWNREKYKGFELYNNSVGIIGFGRVGKILSKYFHVFGVKVFFYDIDNSIEATESAIKLGSIKELINYSNIVILSASYNQENIKFFDQKYIDLLEDKYFINTARGELVDEEYLLKKLKENFFKGVALDVIANEQKQNNLKSFLLLDENCNFILTPHIAGATYSSMHRTEEFIVDKLMKELV